MLLVYDGMYQGAHIQLFTCAPDINTVVSHLHFHLNTPIDRGSGKVTIYLGENINTLLDRVIALYTDSCFTAFKQMKELGHVTIH